MAPYFAFKRNFSWVINLIWISYSYLLIQLWSLKWMKNWEMPFHYFYIFQSWYARCRSYFKICCPTNIQSASFTKYFQNQNQRVQLLGHLLNFHFIFHIDHRNRCYFLNCFYALFECLYRWNFYRNHYHSRLELNRN